MPQVSEAGGWKGGAIYARIASQHGMNIDAVGVFSNILTMITNV
jgi:hypothetical protein